MKNELQKGARARKNFEDTMTKLFRVPKSTIETKPKPKKASGPKGDREK